MIDGLLLAPVMIALMLGTFALVAPAISDAFDEIDQGGDGTEALLIMYAAIFGAAMLSQLIGFLYESLMTGRYGRTWGKRWMHIRPVRIDRQPITYGVAFARAGVTVALGFTGAGAYADQLWCLWDRNRQCLHDKAVKTIVVND